MTVDDRPVRTATAPRLAYRRTGRGGGPLVCLLHSLGTSGTIWAGAARELTGRPLLVPDLRGHGCSDPGEVDDVGEWADDLERVLDDAGAAEPVVLVGVSLGGIQAIAFAATRPERVAALVVADSFAHLPPPVAAARVATQTEQVANLAMAEVAQRYVDATLVDPSGPGADVVRWELAGLDPVSYLAAVRTCFRADVRPLLRAVRAPTLVLWGDLDDRTPRALSEEIAAGIPGSVLRVVPGAGHLAPVDAPAAFAREVTRFLNGHRGAAAPFIRARRGGDDHD